MTIGRFGSRRADDIRRRITEIQSAIIIWKFNLLDIFTVRTDNMIKRIIHIYNNVVKPIGRESLMQQKREDCISQAHQLARGHWRYPGYTRKKTITTTYVWMEQTEQDSPCGP
jgi:hypothetical protein